MSGYDRGEIYSQVAFPADRASKDKEHQARFVEFVREFRVDNNFIYRYALTWPPRLLQLMQLTRL